jgi:trehalose 2-sulfotransferase
MHLQCSNVYTGPDSHFQAISLMTIQAAQGLAFPSIDIILCATQRCGSTLVVEDMRNSAVLGMPEEYFIPWTKRQTKTSWQDAFGSICKRSQSTNGISSIKIMANQLPAVEECLATFIQPKPDCSFPSVAAAFTSSKWVWLKRDNIVAQAISRVMAKQTGINHATGTFDEDHFAGNLLKGYKDDYNKNSIYRFEAILNQVVSIELENLCWKRFFEKACIQPLILVYESVIEGDDMEHLELIGNMVNLERRISKMPRKMVKLSNSISIKWEERFFHDLSKLDYKIKLAARRPDLAD